MVRSFSLNNLFHQNRRMKITVILRKLSNIFVLIIVMILKMSTIYVDDSANTILHNLIAYNKVVGIVLLIDP